MPFLLQRIPALLGVLCMAYGVAVGSAQSGSKFFGFWIALGLMLLMPHFLSRLGFPSAVSRGLRPAAVLILVPALLVCGWCSAKIIGATSAEIPRGLDYIVVLGAQVKKDGPSQVLRYRLDRAVSYLEENPETVCVVSGGKGSNEIEAEGTAMKRYLEEKGIPSERIRVEAASVNTVQNIRFSKELIESDQPAEQYSVGIVTNNFHLYRAVSIARRQGLGEVFGISAPSTRFYLPNNGMREILGILKDTIKGNM